ncbi:TPA: hypothetical protein DCW54_01320 [Candidatus Dependentiae bacterium]|nr:hypothetical protein [Candidatus Dependentiae bacterium]
MFKSIRITTFLAASFITLQTLPSAKSPVPFLYGGLGILAGLAPTAWILSHPFVGNEPKNCPFSAEEKELFTWQLSKQLLQKVKSNKETTKNAIEKTGTLEEWKNLSESLQSSPSGKLKYLELTTGIFADAAKRELISKQMATPFLRPFASFLILKSIASLLTSNVSSQLNKEEQPLSNNYAFAGGLELTSLLSLPLMFILPAMGRHNQIVLSHKLFGKRFSGNISPIQAHLGLLIPLACVISSDIFNAFKTPSQIATTATNTPQQRRLY